MILNPKLYEINTRVWVQNIQDKNLKNIPEEFFEYWASKGFNCIYFMGIWETTLSVIEKYCFQENLIKAYNKSLKNWRKSDVIGSPFAIERYKINPGLGSCEDLLSLKNKLNQYGIKLIVDFIPNHFSAESSYIKTNPEYFLQADEETLARDSFTFYRSPFNNNIFAHGRDPLFPAWTDTVQVNYFNPEARKFMIENLLKIAETADGVRCDMAMLPLNNVFHNTWLGILNKQEIEKPSTEFWKDAIDKVKEKYPDFIFIAEAYWDLEWDLQQLGFDFTYDKRLMERLAANDIIGVKAHLLADISFQQKSVRFLENHDEQRASVKFGKFRSLAAAVVINTIPGMKFFYDGQFEGRKINIPLQLGREPVEKISNTIRRYYEKIFDITKDEIFINGKWRMLESLKIENDDKTYENIFAWQWQLENQYRFIAINYSGSHSSCRIKFEFNSEEENLVFKDLLSGEEYLRSVNEIKEIGIVILLKPYQSHIFVVKT